MFKGTKKPSSDLIWQDTQHNMLFDILDELALEHPPLNLISKLRFYADHHFLVEEAYMEKVLYPGRDQHVAAHNRFRQELTQLESEFSNNQMTLDFRQTVSNFLSEWLVRHIQGVDKDFEAFVIQSSYK